MPIKISSWDSADWLPTELIYWLNVPSYPPVWSRLCKCNAGKIQRFKSESKFGSYDIEIPDELWSLWGFLHPRNQIFDHKTRGKQSLACNILACCAANLYPLTKWTPKIMDAIIISGDRYYRESFRNFYCDEHQFALHDLNCSCRLDNMCFKIHTEIVTYGAFYENNKSPVMNLAKSLIYFFSRNRMGILRCRHQRAVVIGRDISRCGDYFMYDCQSTDYPLFRKGEGVPYLLRCKTLQMLLYILVMALEVRGKKVQFTLHKVEVRYESCPCQDDEDILTKLNRTVAKRKQARVNANMLRTCCPCSNNKKKKPETTMYVCT